MISLEGMDEVGTGREVVYFSMTDFTSRSSKTQTYIK